MDPLPGGEAAYCLLPTGEGSRDQAEIDDIEILHYKKPSIIHEVNFGEAIDVLYSSELYSEDYK